MKTLFLILFCFGIFSFLNAQIYRYGDEVYVAGKPGNYSLIHGPSGRVLASKLPYSEITTDVHHGMIGVRQGKLFGIISPTGKLICKPQFTANSDDEGYNEFIPTGKYFTVYKNGLKSLVDSSGKFALPFSNYTQVFDAGYGICGGEKEGKFGLFKGGKQILPFEYENALYYENFSFTSTSEQQIQPIARDGKIGLISKDGEFIVEPTFEYVQRLNTHYFALRENGVYSIVDCNNSWILPTSFNELVLIKDNYVIGKTGNQYGLISLQGKEILPTTFEQIYSPIENDKVFALKEAKLGLVDLNKPEETQYIYDKFTPVISAAKTILVRKNGLFGMIKLDGQLVIPCEYNIDDESINFYSGSLVMKRNNKIGLINEYGVFLIPCQYDSLALWEGYPITVKNNGKFGKVDEIGRVVIPCIYDKIGQALSNDDWVIAQDGKEGVYRKDQGEITAPIYDSIGSYLSYYLVKQAGKYGLLQNNGVQLIPPVHDEFYGGYDDGYILANEKGKLVQYHAETGEKQTLTPDSIHKFETTTLYNFGGKRDGTTYWVNGREYPVIYDGTWFFIENTSGNVIGKPYYEMGHLDKSDKVVAKPFGQDYTIGLNTKGENLKPNFHLETKSLLSKFCMDTVVDTLYAHMTTAGLLKNLHDPANGSYMKEHFVVEFMPTEIYTEWGDPIPGYYLDVYEKTSYFNFKSDFPNTPFYVFNFYDYYYRLGAKNKDGWQWAVPKTKHAEGYYFLDGENKVPLSFCVLVNDQGEVKQKTNYQPIESLPFFTISIPNEIDWNQPETFEQIRDSLNHFFPALKNLSAKEFGLLMKDSIHSTHLGYESYIEPEVNNYGYAYEYSFYKVNNLQLFNYPPPISIKYEFFPNDISKIESAIPLKELPNLERFRLGDKRAFSFANYRYFIAPVVHDDWTDEQLTTAIENLKRAFPNAQIKLDLDNYSNFEQLIKLGVAREAFTYDLDKELMGILSNASDQLKVYQYTTTLNLVYENKVLLEPKYRLAALDTVGGKPRFLLLDTSLHLNWLDLETGKITKVKDETLVFADAYSVLTRSTKNHTFNSYSRAEIPDNGYWSEFWFMLGNDHDIIRFAHYEQSVIPYSTLYGEDSIITSENGIIYYVYPPADTLIYSYYNDLKQNFPRTLYQTEDGVWKSWFNNLPEQIHYSKYALSAQMPLNYSGYRNFAMEVKNDQVVFSNDKGINFQISEQEYLKIKDQVPGSPGYGGAKIKGVYYSYQNLLPFPEKHALIIGINNSSYLIGNKNTLELVRLDENNIIVKRCTQLFSSYADYLEKYAAAVNEGDPIYDFWFR